MMDRLQKKCLTASVGTHVSLMLVLVFGSAFNSEAPKPIHVASLKVVPSILVDSALAGGGGNPNIKPSEDRQKGNTMVPQPKEAPKPPQKEEPKKPEPKKPEPKKEEPKTEPKKDDKPPTVKPEKAKPAEPTKLNLKKLKPNELKEFTKADQAAQEAKQNQAAKEQVDRMRETLKDLTNTPGFNDGTQIEVHGTGGEAYASYDSFVYEVYRNAWKAPAELSDSRATAQLKVVIRRDGTVESARVAKPSGNPELDRSVDALVRKVTFVAKFPEGAKDSKRTYFINFNLLLKAVG